MFELYSHKELFTNCISFNKIINFMSKLKETPRGDVLVDIITLNSLLKLCH
jgi:hypothetical protein